MTRRITPTGWGRTGGREIKLLGSTAAVLEAIGRDGVFVASSMAKVHAAAEMAPGESYNLRFVLATHGTEPFYRLPPETVIGVDVEAWHGVPGAMWDAVQRVIETRFKTVHWG